jgi:spermidine/putrescine transport system permease protein
MVYALIPFMILPTYSSVEKMDWSLVAASRDMGASPARAFLTVTLPLTAPGMLAGIVLTFVPAVGLFFISDLLGGATDVYAGNLVRDQLLKARDWPFAAAISVVLLILTLLTLLIYRRAGGRTNDMNIF